MSDGGRIRIMLVDDHPVVRAGLAGIVATQSDLELVGEAGTAAEAIEQFARLSPDLSLVDLSLPDRSGIELIGILHAKSPLAKFVVLTGNLGGNDIARAIQAGAHAYLSKDVTADELLTTIRTVSRGARYLSATVGNKVEGAAARPDLTPRELDVLRWIVRGHSNSQIATELALAEETVKTHVKHILGKLGVSSRSKAAAMSLKSGLVQSDEM
ncbi:MAG TPA: response regulator transcription factor [Xanthomonadaceae bacterium]|jgi:DNA-binding NarL/FixJ family response regulator|nr:response regulator transcription factor [Xanthomonadaceae bacterium]